MRLRDIAKPYNELVGDAPMLSPDLDVINVSESMLQSLPPVILVGEKGESMGKIDREVLRYIKSKCNIAKMGFILERLEEGVIAVDADSRIFLANHVCTQLFGLPVGKLVGKPLPDCEAGAAIAAALETRAPVANEKAHIRGTDRYVSLRVFPINLNGAFEGVVAIFRDATESNALNREITRVTEMAMEYRSRIRACENMAELGIVGDDPKFARVLQQAMLVARTDATVLLRGENGTGKEVLAALIRNHSERENRPFITVNCAAVPESLIEAELFGHGAEPFAGAKKSAHAGKLHLADGGTLFLDEVGDMPYSMQGKLLRFLQQGEIEHLGGAAARPLNVRVIASTNQPLEEMIARKQFRRDFYYRLNVFTISVPPLRERGHDLLLLTRSFLAHFNRRYGGSLELTRETYRRLADYSWPGNVRELKNYVERSVILASWADIDPPAEVNVMHIPHVDSGEDDKADGAENVMATTMHEALHTYERMLLSAALKRNGYNRSEAMRELGMSRRTFYRKLAEHQLHAKNGA